MHERVNEHYISISIAEKSSGKKPLLLGNSSDASQNEMTVKEIISVCVVTILALDKLKIYVSLKINLICQMQAQVALK